MATIQRGVKNYHPNSGPRRADNLDDDGETIGSKWGVPGAPKNTPKPEASDEGTPKKVPKKETGTPEKVPRKNRRKRKGLLDLLFD